MAAYFDINDMAMKYGTYSNQSLLTELPQRLPTLAEIKENIRRVAACKTNGPVCVFPDSIPDSARGNCSKCRRRQAWAQCRKCVARICALCSWTVYPYGEDERCRDCAETQW